MLSTIVITTPQWQCIQCIFNQHWICLFLVKLFQLGFLTKCQVSRVWFHHLMNQSLTVNMLHHKWTPTFMCIHIYMFNIFLTYYTTIGNVINLVDRKVCPQTNKSRWMLFLFHWTCGRMMSASVGLPQLLMMFVWPSTISLLPTSPNARHPCTST